MHNSFIIADLKSCSDLKYFKAFNIKITVLKTSY